MGKASTGASNGRVGGRLSGGTRARKALHAASRVRVVGPVAKTPGGGSGAVSALVGALDMDPLAAASAAVLKMGQMLGLSPNSMKQSSQVALAAVAAAQAVGGSAAAATSPALEQLPSVPASAKGKGRALLAAPTPAVVTFPKKKVRAADTPATGLCGGKRGQLVAVQPKSSYAAGKTYNWDDVVAVGTLIASGKIKGMVELDEKLKDGSLKYKVPRTTMNSWVKDDWCAPVSMEHVSRCEYSG